MRHFLYTFVCFSVFYFMSLNINNSFKNYCIEKEGKYKYALSKHFINSVAKHKNDIIKGSNSENSKHGRRISQKFNFDNHLSLYFEKINEYRYTAPDCINEYCVNRLSSVLILHQLRI